MLSVYTRHHPDCKNAGDKSWRRCSCPKWIWGSLHGTFIRKSAKTHDWETAEDLRQKLTETAQQQPVLAALPASTDPVVAASPSPIQPALMEILPPAKPRVSILDAVDAHIADARSRELASRRSRAA